MRLLVLSSWFPSPPSNGSKLRAWHLLRELSARHEVTLLTFAERGEAEPDHLAALRAFCAEVQVVTGNPHKPETALKWRNYFGRIPRSYAQTFNPTMACSVRTLSTQAQAVVAFQIGTALYLPGAVTGPSVYDEAEGSTVRDRARSATEPVQRWQHALAWKKYAAFTRHLVASTSRTTVVSEAERACLGEAGCDLSRVTVLTNGVAEAYLTIDVPKRPGTLIYNGAVSYAPNLDAVEYFVSGILPRIRAARRATSFAVTGAHAGVAVDHLVRGGAEFTGFVPDVARLVAESEVCVVPLRRGGGTRLKILEAMALGTPVVATRKGAEGLDVSDGEHLLLADDAEAFARAVLALLTDTDLARAIAANARRLVAARYTWGHVGQRLDDVLTAAVETHGRRRAIGGQ